VVEEGSGGSVDVREGVLGFAVLGENSRSDLVKLVDVLEDRVLDDVLAGDTELLKSHETGIRLTENGVTVTGDDLTLLESRPDEFNKLLVGGRVTKFLLHAEDESKYFLVSETVEGTSETTESSRVGKEGIGKGGTDQVSGVSGDVSTLVIGVESVVETDELDETLGFSEADLVGKVERKILIFLNGSHVLSSTEVGVVVDASSDGERLGDTVEGVLEGRLPVFSLLHTRLVLGGELRVVVEGGDTDDELSHRVKSLGAGIKNGLNVLGEVRSGNELLLELLGLGF